jgi:pimeloyl-ACP methyl ester carboxylesterase/uncharacterized protein YukE
MKHSMFTIWAHTVPLWFVIPFMVLVSEWTPPGSIRTNIEQQTNQVPRFESANCQTMLGTFENGRTFNQIIDEGIRNKYECGNLIVPADYNNLEKGNIRLQVIHVEPGWLEAKERDGKPLLIFRQNDPIIILHGGPGGSAIDSYLSDNMHNFSLLAGGRPVILFDQRGSRRSDPNLMCPPENLRELYEMDGQRRTIEEKNRLSLNEHRRCVDQLTRELGNISLSDFNSEANARDIESLRTSLNYKNINLYGGSYGSLLAQYYLASFGSNVRSVVLDGVVPIGLDFLLHSSTAFHRSIREVFDDCDQHNQCREENPELRSAYADLEERLGQNPTTIQINVTVDPNLPNQPFDTIVDRNFFNSRINKYLRNTGGLLLIPNMITEASHGNYTPLRDHYQNDIRNRDLNGVYYTIYCSEFPPYELANFNISQVPEIYQNELRLDAQLMREVCRLWNPLNLSLSRQVSFQTQVPTLMLSGRFDPVTPPRYANLAAGPFSNHTLITFPLLTHGVLGNGECTSVIVSDFFKKPNDSHFNCNQDKVTLPFNATNPPDGQCYCTISTNREDQLRQALIAVLEWLTKASKDVQDYVNLFPQRVDDLNNLITKKLEEWEGYLTRSIEEKVKEWEENVTKSIEEELEEQLERLAIELMNQLMRCCRGAAIPMTAVLLLSLKKRHSRQ